MFTPESEGQFSMNQLVVVELKVLETQYKIYQNLGIFGLRVQNTCEANVHTVGKEEVLRKEIV